MEITAEQQAEITAIDLEVDDVRSKYRTKMQELQLRKLYVISKDLPKPRIEVYGLRGPSGDRDTPPYNIVWNAQIVYDNGNTEVIKDGFMDEGYGHITKASAERKAYSKSKICGWPVIDRGNLEPYYVKI